jgi:hypothetical protein
LVIVRQIHNGMDFGSKRESHMFDSLVDFYAPF